MSAKLYVGNLSYDVDDSSLNEMFSEFGTVLSARVVMDRDSGRSKGFGFVEMEANTAAEEATSALNGKQLNGRALTVNEARPQTQNNNRRSPGSYQRGFRN